MSDRIDELNKWASRRNQQVHTNPIRAAFGAAIVVLSCAASITMVIVAMGYAFR